MHRPWRAKGPCNRCQSGGERAPPVPNMRFIAVVVALWSAACVPVTYAVRGREIADSPPQSAVVTLQVGGEARIEQIARARVGVWRAPWDLADPASRADFVAQAETHPDATFLLESTNMRTLPAWCALGGAVVGAIGGFVIGSFIGRDQVPGNDAPAFGIRGKPGTGVVLGLPIGAFAGAVLCAALPGPQPAHLRGAP